MSNQETQASEASANVAQPASWQTKLGVAVVVVCALAALFWPKGDGTRAAPPGMLIDSGGRPVTLASKMAPVTLLHFWATWCAPCIPEVPSIQKLEAELGTDHNFTLLMIAVNDDPAKMTTFLGDGAHASLFDHDWKIAKRYGTRKVPETHLIVDGRIEESYIGAQDWSDPTIRARIQAALDKVRASG